MDKAIFDSIKLKLASTLPRKAQAMLYGSQARGDARAQLGGSWRMPTAQEQSELIDNCRSKWFTYKYINGYLFIGTNNNCIFLPAAGEIGSAGTLSGNSESGRYWAGTLDANSSTRISTGSLYICKSFASAGFNGWCHSRLTIRPVTNKPK